MECAEQRTAVVDLGARIHHGAHGRGVGQVTDQFTQRRMQKDVVPGRTKQSPKRGAHGAIVVNDMNRLPDQMRSRPCGEQDALIVGSSTA